MDYRYTYNGNTTPTAADRDRGVQPYRADPRLVKAVKLAIALRRPLLLQGEPGSGKTQLAFNLAYELARNNNLPAGQDWPMESWPVQSVSQARDGLYRYDAIGRLSNAQLANLGREEAKDVSAFIDYGALGWAFLPNDRQGQPQDKRVIVLIDEIDKADIDFPNDLLWVLDQRAFDVPELGNRPEARVSIEKERSPIVIITSNREKELPGPFLRRCFYHFIKFPEKEDLEVILTAHVPDFKAALRTAAVERFLQARADMEARTLPGKLISTSELIDWVKALQIDSNEEEISQQLATMQADLEKTPHKSALFKSQEQFQAYGGQDEAQS